MTKFIAQNFDANKVKRNEMKQGYIKLANETQGIEIKKTINSVGIQ